MSNLYDELGIEYEKKRPNLYDEMGIPYKKNIEPTIESSFLSKLPKNINIGGAKMGRNLLNLIGIKTPNSSNEDIERFFGQDADPTQADLMLQGISQYLPALVLPATRVPKAISQVPKVGGYLEKVLGNMLTQGGYAASQREGGASDKLESGSEAAETSVPFSLISSAIESGSPALRLGARLAGAGASGYLGRELSKELGGGEALSDLAALTAAGLGLHGVSPKLQARRTALQGVEGTPYGEKLGAASRLGLDYLTPAEASGNPFVGGQQGTLGKTDEGARMLYERGEKRVLSEKKSIDKLLDTVYHGETLDPYTKDLYKQSYSKKLPDEALDSFNDNEVVKRAVRMVENKPAFKESLKGVSRDSVAYWDHVKQALDDMAEKAPSKEAKIITGVKKDILGVMDDSAPEYNQARQLAERQINRRKIEDKLNEAQYRGTDFYNKIIKNDKLFNSLMHSFRNVPQAQQQLKDMRLVFRDLINPPTVRTAAGLSKTSMNQERSDFQQLATRIKNKLTGGKFDKAAIELITNPKWSDELNKINELSDFEKKSSKFMDLLGRAASQKAGS